MQSTIHEELEDTFSELFLDPVPAEHVVFTQGFVSAKEMKEYLTEREGKSKGT